jgi:glutathione peroxidase
MLIRAAKIACLAAIISSAALAAQPLFADAPATAPAADNASVLHFTMNDIDGKPVDLSTYAGKVILFVNVASHCGNTPQYQALEALYKSKKDQGFVILGFPANNFMGQEPGTNEQIKMFCTAKYDVTFPMFSKISVKGKDQAPLYQTLTAVDAKPKGAGDISWNFEKILVDRQGHVVARFTPKTKPDAPDVTAAIESALAAK